MSGRKYKPPDFSAPRSRTPNLNSTVSLAASSSRVFRRGGPLSSATNLDITFAGSGSNFNPKLKSSAAVPAIPCIDWDLECDFAYNEYLQALMKQSIATNLIEEHEQDVKDQLAIQNDRLHKMDEQHQNTKRQITCLEVSKNVKEVIDLAQKTLDQFNYFANENDLQMSLQDLRSKLDEAHNLIYLKNVAPISDQEGYERLFKLIQKSLVVIDKIKNSGRDVEGVNNLADVISKFQDVSNSVSKDLLENNEIQKNATFEYLKCISDMYAQQEHYFEIIS